MTQPTYESWMRILGVLRNSLDQMENTTSLREGFYVQGSGETDNNELCQFSHYFYPGLVISLRFDPNGYWQCKLPVSRGRVLDVQPTADGRVQMTIV